MNLTGLIVLIAVLVAATAVGLWYRCVNGRLKEVSRYQVSHDPAAALAEALTPAQLGGPLGERATLVAFSSSFCGPCRATRQILRAIADEVAGVHYIEVDAESNLDLVRRLDVRRTPTTLVLNAAGLIQQRAAGQPRKADVVAALEVAILASAPRTHARTKSHTKKIPQCGH